MLCLVYSYSAGNSRMTDCVSKIFTSPEFKVDSNEKESMHTLKEKKWQH